MKKIIGFLVIIAVISIVAAFLWHNHLKPQFSLEQAELILQTGNVPSSLQDVAFTACCYYLAYGQTSEVKARSSYILRHNFSLLSDSLQKQAQKILGEELTDNDQTPALRKQSNQQEPTPKQTIESQIRLLKSLKPDNDDTIVYLVTHGATHQIRQGAIEWLIKLGRGVRVPSFKDADYDRVFKLMPSDTGHLYLATLLKLSIFGADTTVQSKALHILEQNLRSCVNEIDTWSNGNIPATRLGKLLTRCLRLHDGYRKDNPLDWLNNSWFVDRVFCPDWRDDLINISDLDARVNLASLVLCAKTNVLSPRIRAIALGTLYDDNRHSWQEPKVDLLLPLLYINSSADSLIWHEGLSEQLERSWNGGWSFKASFKTQQYFEIGTRALDSVVRYEAFSRFMKNAPVDTVSLPLYLRAINGQQPGASMVAEALDRWAKSL